MTPKGMGENRAIVHVLMRGVTYFADAPTERIIGPFRLAIVGEADPKRWPKRRIRPGDVEGIVYTTPAEIPRVVNAILALQGVLDAHGDAGTPTIAPPPGRR